MRTRLRWTGIGIWVFTLSLLVTRLWLAYPDTAPLPQSISERLVHLYGAQNAEQVADLEIIVGLAISVPLVSVLTYLMIALLRRH